MENVEPHKENIGVDAHYRFIYKGIKIDPYRIMKLYGIADPAHQHAVKKLLRAGRSPAKNLETIAAYWTAHLRARGFMADSAVLSADDVAIVNYPPPPLTR